MTENYSDMPRVKTSVSPSSVRQTATSGDTVADDRHRKKLSSRKLLQEETAHDPIRLRKAMESAEAAAFGAKNAETDVRNFAVDIQELLGKGTEKSTKELESRISIFASRMTISNKKAAIAADEACSAAETAQLLGSKLLFEHSRKSTGVNDGTKDTVEDTIVRQLERVGKATRAAMESAERAQCQALECLTLMDETSTRRNARTETLQTTLKSTYNILSVEGGAAKSPRMSSTRSRMQNTHSKLYSTVDDYNKSRSFTTTAGNVVPAAKSAESVAEISSGTLVASSGISVSQNPSATAAVTTTTATTATTTRGAINLPEGVDNFHRLGLLIQHTREAERAAECASSSSSTAHKEAKKGEEICAAAQRAYENETDRSSIDVATNAQVIEKKSKLASTKLDAARRRANIAFVETVRATEETRRLVALTQKYAAEMDSAAALAAAAATNASTSSNSTISDSSNHSNHSNTGPLLSRASAALVEVTAACERTTEAEESLEASSRRLRSVAAETSLLLVEAYATAEHMALERHQREEEEEVAEQRRRAVREQQQQQQQQQLQLVDTVLDRVQDAVISQLVKKQSIAVVREYIGRDRDASTKSANESISHAVNAYLNEALDECILEIAAGQKQELEQIAPIKEKRGQEGMMIAEGVDSNENLPSESLQSGNSSPERGQLESLKRLFLVLKSNYQIEESRKQLMEHIHHAMDANPSTAAVVMKWVRRFQARVVLRARLRCIPGGSGSGSGGVDGLGGHPAVYARLGLTDVPDTVCLRYHAGWVRKYSPQQVFMRLLSPSSSSQSLPKQQQQQEEEEGHPFILVLVAGAMFLLPRDAQCTLGDAISALWVNEVKTLEFGSGLHPTRGNFLHIATDSEDWYLKFPGSIRAQELRAWLRKIEYATSKPKIGVTLQPPMMATVATTTTITAVGVDQQSLHPSVAFLHRIEAISTHPCEEFPALSLLTKYITPIQRWWRDAVLPKLSIIRHQCQESSAVIVQRWYRHCMFRHKGQHLLRLHREKNAVRMQTIFRGYSARNLYKVIQVARLRELSAICIQTNFRAYSARNLYIIMQVVRLRELSATCIQTQFRAYSGRMIYMAVRTIRDRELAAIRIQTVFRMYSATIFSKAVRRIRYRYLAAVKIQSWYRQQSILFSWHVLLTYRHECAVRIQTTYRTSRQQRRWCLMRIKVYQLQSWMRRMRILMVERRHQVKNLRGRCDYYDQKATIIQQWYHGYYKVSELQKAARMAWMIRQIMFQQKPRHIQTLQRWARYMLAYKSLRLHKKAKREERNALRLQCWVRQRLAISTLTRLRTQKQKHMRNIAFQLRCSQKLLRRLRNIRRSVIVLQCWMRMVYAKKRLRLLRLQNRSNKQGNSAFTRVKQKLEAMKVLREVQERQL